MEGKLKLNDEQVKAVEHMDGPCLLWLELVLVRLEFLLKE